ncbi:MAG: hypothetical protein RBT38_14435, partial [Bacteroidales bacterium]|nr:hypothetical protein [Bacteroidales bacterium]
ERVAKLTGFFHGLLCPPGHGRLFKKMIEQFRKRVRLPAQSGLYNCIHTIFSAKNLTGNCFIQESSSGELNRWKIGMRLKLIWSDYNIEKSLNHARLPKGHK